MAKNRIAIEIELEDADQNTFSKAAGATGLGAFLKSCVESYLHEYATGGLLLTGPEIGRINKITGKPVQASSDIIDSIEKSAKQHKGQRVFQLEIDPALLETFKGYAEFQGVSLDEFVNQCWGEILANGWLYQMNTEITWVPFSPENIKYIKKAAGQDEGINSATVMKVLRKTA